MRVVQLVEGDIDHEVLLRQSHVLVHLQKSCQLNSSTSYLPMPTYL